jgi:hypothetical protein
MLAAHQAMTAGAISRPGAGVEGQQQLGHLRAVPQPGVVGLDPLQHVGGFAVDGELAWPLQQRQTAVAGRVRPAVRLHVRIGELPGDRPEGKGLFDEQVLVEHHGLADPGG